MLRAASDAGQKEAAVPLFLIERNFAELVQTDPETNALVKEVNDEMGIQWLFSFLSADKRKTYCLYEAPDPEAIRAAARRLGVPADTIVEIGGEVGPLAEMMVPVRERMQSA
jgi:Nickel responsive protein SCO4226-like